MHSSSTLLVEVLDNDTIGLHGPSAQHWRVPDTVTSDRPAPRLGLLTASISNAALFRCMFCFAIFYIPIVSLVYFNSVTGPGKFGLPLSKFACEQAPPPGPE